MSGGKISKAIIEGVGTVIGSAIMAIGVSSFLLPNQLSSGGFSGVATITYYLLKIPMGAMILTLNIPQASYSNKERVCICIAQTIPVVTSAETVVITIGAGATQYPLRTRYGNKYKM